MKKTKSQSRLSKSRYRTLFLVFLKLALLPGMPSLAQPQCGETEATAKKYADCAWFNYSNSPWNLRDDGYEHWRVEYNEFNCDDENHWVSQFRDPQLRFKRFSQMTKPGGDRQNLYSLGVDPATLVPEALDLNIFPAIEISSELVLQPSLSYSPDHLISRAGHIAFAPPKRWQNHYGELALVVGRTDGNKNPVGPEKPGGDSNEDRLGVASEIEVFFINASGQQVSFYPDPDQFQTGDLNVPDGAIRFWFSGEGNYRLEDLNHATDATKFDWSLNTPDGLTYRFERYLSNLDDAGEREMNTKREWLCLRFRVKTITDRYGNKLEITYRATNSLQPDVIKAPGMANAAGQPMAIDYDYEAVAIDGETYHRLTEIKVPGFGGTTQTFKFYYPDSTTDTGTQRHALNGIGEQALTLQNDKAVLNPLVEPLPVYCHNGGSGEKSGLYFNIDDLGFVPRPAFDFMRQRSGGDPSFVSEGYRYQIQTAGNPVMGSAGGNLQDPEEGDPNPRRFRFRYELDDYPFIGTASYPDKQEGEIVGLSSGEYQAAILPIIKKGDAVVWRDQSGLHTLEISDEEVANGQVGLSGSVSGMVANAYHIRKDNRLRIAEIEFPSAANSATKRLVLVYDDFSLNHGELAAVRNYDDFGSGEDPKLVSESQYTYERITVASASEEAEEILPETKNGNVPEWKHCIKAGREINPAVNPVQKGLTHGGRFEEMDILRQKTVRYRKLPTESGEDNFGELTTRYGGAYHFALLGQNSFDENQPASLDGDPNRTCDYMVWSLASKPFNFTWQIDPDGSATVFDLSPHGLGLEPALAFANRRRRVFKTYRFDTGFRQAFKAAFAPFLSDQAGGRPFSGFYHFMPETQVDLTQCQTPSCLNGQATLLDLQAYPQLPAAYPVPAMASLFSLSSKCYGAELTTFEWVPLWKYTSTTDAGHPSDFLRRLTVKTLHGSIHWREEPNIKPGHYFRFSAIKAVADAIEKCTQGPDPIEVFFKGGLTSTAHIQGDPGEEKDLTIDWDYGGRSDVGSPFQYFHDRQQTHRLRPHSQTSLRKLGGFAWDNTRNLIDLDLGVQGGTSKWVVEVKRFSNGGYLGTGSGTADKNFGEVSSWFYDQEIPPDLTNGDLLVHRNFIYRIEHFLNNYILITPGLKSAITSSDTLHFYRMSGGPSTAYPYVGYDAFGNNSFQAVYKKDKVFWPAPATTEATADFDLVPLFFDDNSHPFSLSLNDSILPYNNDSGVGVTPGGWRFFGRVRAQFTGAQLGLIDYSDSNPIPIEGWKYGQSELFFYEDSGGGYPWLPLRSRKWFGVDELKSTSAPLVHVKGLDPQSIAAFLGGTPYQEDVVTHYRYFGAPGVANTFPTGEEINHGKVALQWSGKSATDTFSQQTATRNQYDPRGRLTNQYTATFAMDDEDGTTPYIQAVTYLRDANTGLPTSETSKVFAGYWDDAGTDLATTFVLTGSGTTQGRKVTEYDALGRPIQQTGLNAQLQPFGPISETLYHSQTKQTVRTLHPEPPQGQSDLMTEIHQYRNGLGLEMGQWRTRSGESDQAFVKANDYDAFARRIVTGSERMETIAAITPDNWMANPEPNKKGHTQTRYNQRGEAFGQVLYKGPSDLEGSTWTHFAQDGATGNALIYTLSQTEDADASTNLPPQKLNIKLHRLDAYGLTRSVEDYQEDESDEIWEHMDDDDLAGKVANPGTMLDKAIYTYDRFGNVIEAEVGLTNTQTRKFAFDQFNRLRLESHPEMTDGTTTNSTTVVYGAFDHFDNPTQVSYLDGNAAVLRQWQYHYYPNGELAEVKDRNGSTLSDFTYMFNAYLGSGSSLPAFPANLRFARHHLDQVTAYVHDYDPATGLLSERSLYHNLPDYPGFTPQIGTVDLTSGSGSEATLPTLGAGIDPVTLSYTYNVLGLLKTETYPATITDLTTPTQLKMTYGPDGLLNSVEDAAFTPPLPLLEKVTYGIDNLPSSTRWARPGSGGSNEVIYERDSLSRLSKWSVQWNNGSGQFSESRDYSYDSSGRIWNIKAGANRIYSYAYDGLGQIAQARLTDTLLGSGTNPATAVYDYTYDGDGLGNLMALTVNGSGRFSGAVDLTNNQLQIDNAGYNPFGELTQMTRDGADYAMGYNAMGRMNAYAHQPISGDPQLSANYAYDHAGMRVFNQTTDVAAGTASARLYFYDDANMVLCEWVAEDGGPPRWDKSYVYFDGKSSLTYEHDGLDGQAGGAAPLPAGPTMTHPFLLDSATFTWDGDSQQVFDLEVQDEFNDVKGFYHAIAGTSFQAPPFFKAGKYRARVRLTDQVWGPWHDFVFVPESARDLAGDFRFNLEGRDASFFKNHLDSTAFQYIEGLEREALHFPGSVSMTVPEPFQYTDQDRVTVAFWVKLPAPAGFQPASTFQLLKFSGLKVQFTEEQILKLNWPGTPSQSSSTALTPGVWNHVALVFGDGEAKLYLNGQLIMNPANAPTGFAFGTIDMEFNSGNANLTWEGELDYLRFWNRALTSTEIHTEYNRYSSGN